MEGDVSIKSDSFGRVFLTKEDAQKFKSQVTYGRPKAAAVETVKRGLKLAEQFENTGKVSFKIKVPA